MHKLAKKGLLVVATTGALASAAVGVAHAGSDAQGAAVGSPGVVSGNNIQVPIHIPVNVCGNTIDVVGALNPAFGNHCANVSHERPPVSHPPTDCSPCTEPPKTHPPTNEPPKTHPPTTKPPKTHPPTNEPPKTHPPTTKPPTTKPPTGGNSGGTTGETTSGSTAGRTGDPQVKGENRASSLAQTGSSALTVAPIGVALLLGGFVLYRRSRPEEN
jgi:LPXTG-motif cell wall-anchored protein